MPTQPTPRTGSSRRPGCSWTCTAARALSAPRNTALASPSAHVLPSLLQKCGQGKGAWALPRALLEEPDLHTCNEHAGAEPQTFLGDPEPRGWRDARALPEAGSALSKPVCTTLGCPGASCWGQGGGDVASWLCSLGISVVPGREPGLWVAQRTRARMPGAAAVRLAALGSRLAGPKGWTWPVTQP